VGTNASALKERATVIGAGASSVHTHTVVVGTGASTTHRFSVAVGAQSTAHDAASAFGYNASAPHEASMALGNNSQSTATRTATFGLVGSSGQYKDVQTSGNLRVSARAEHGEEILVKKATTLLTSLSGGSVVASGLIPIGAFGPIGLGLRVVNAVTGAAGINLGDGVDVDRWGQNIPVAAGTTTDNGDWTDGTVQVFSSGSDVVLTPVGGSFTGGDVRITVFYWDFVPPIS
jgi:hypothetical protein